LNYVLIKKTITLTCWYIYRVRKILTRVEKNNFIDNDMDLPLKFSS